MGTSTSDGLYTINQFKQPFLGDCPLQLRPPGSAPTAGEVSPLPLPATPQSLQQAKLTAQIPDPFTACQQPGPLGPLPSSEPQCHFNETDLGCRP